MDQTRYYIDGLNFYYGAVKGTPHKWVDFEALCRQLTPDDNITKIRYFTARVKPRFPDDRAHERQNAFLRAIARSDLVEITFGHFRLDFRWRPLAEAKYPPHDLFRPELRPRWAIRLLLNRARRRSRDGATVARVKVPEEKGSDVNLASHLLHDAFHGRCTRAVVVTNDSDLETPISMAVQLGVDVTLVNPHFRRRANQSLLKAANTPQIVLTEEMIARSQMPTPAVGRNGKQIHKPHQW